jgi:hypothetical protein
MKKFFSQYTQEGLPNGANQITTNSQGFIVSERGQWDFPGQPTMIPNANGKITMKNVYDRLLGIDDQGNAMIMEPGGEYQFPGNNVFEIPLPKAQMGVIGQQASNKRKGNIYPYLSYGTEGSYPTAGVEYIKDIPSRDRTLQQAVGAGLYGSPEKVGVGARYSSKFRDPQKPFKALMDVYGGYGTDQGFYTGLGAYPMFDIVDRKDASFRAGPYFGYGIQTKLPEGIASAIESEGTYFDDPQNLPFSQKLPLTSSFRYGAGAEGRLKDFYGKAKFWFDPIQGKLSDPTSDNPIIKAYQEKEGTEQVHFKPSFEISAGYNIPVSSNRRKIKEQIAKTNLEKEREKIRAQQESMPLNETFFVKSQDLKNRILDPVTTKPTKKQRYKFRDGGASSPEEWEQEIRAIESQIGNPSGWSLSDYNQLQNKLNDYRSWRETTPEGQAVIDYHNQEGEYDIPLPEHLQDYTNAMMKSRLAYANEFGNPAAQRMIVMPDQPYDFDNGYTGTHFMSSMDNYAVPQIQDENGQLVLGDYGPESKEAIKFDRPEDAEYFSENYKDVSPAFIEIKLSPKEIDEYRKGGYIVEYLDDPSIPELTKAQEGIEKEQDLPGMYAYADKKKQKRFANLLDQAKAFGKTIEGRIVDKENIYPDFSIKNVGQYVKDVKEYQKQAADYEKARRLVKEGTMSRESFLDRYNKNNWAKFDQATRVSTPEEQAELEETWYGPIDEEGRRRWMSDPRNVAKVAGAVAVGAPLAPAAAILAPAAGAALANPLVQAGLTGYGVYDAATNTLPEAYRDFSEGRYLEGLGNTAMAALDVAPIPIFGTNLLDEAAQGAKYFTSKQPISTSTATKQFIKTNADRTVPSRSGIDNTTLEDEYLTLNKMNQISGGRSVVPVQSYSDKTLIMDDLTSAGYQELDKFIDAGGKVNRKAISNLKNDLDLWHNEGIIHGDLKSNNIFYNPQTKELKVIDPVGYPEDFKSTNFEEFQKAIKNDNDAFYKTFSSSDSNDVVRSGLGGIDMKQYEVKNPEYYLQLLNTYNKNQLSASNKKFYKDLIETIKKQDGIVTERQYQELQRLKTGNFNYGKKAYKSGGSVELNLTPEEIQWYTDNGYVVEEV